MIVRRFHTALVAILTVIATAPCHAQSFATESATVHPVVEITGVDYAFRAPDTIPAGWTTLRFVNEGEEHHFVYLSRIPEGKTLHDYETELSAPFSAAWYALRDGRTDVEGAFAMVGEAMPAWYADVQVMGGPGLSAPGRTAEVTVHLEPGTYIAECYVKTPEGEVHYMEGMLRPIEVTGGLTDTPPPTADATVTVSNFAMDIEGDLAPGRRTLAVHFAEHPEQGFGHSVHVARLDAETDVEEVVQWMNWFNINGLRTPAPATFIGGTHPMAAGRTAYVTLDLEPGRYLFLSEATAHQGVLREVTVAP